MASFRGVLLIERGPFASFNAYPFSDFSEVSKGKFLVIRNRKWVLDQRGVVATAGNASRRDLFCSSPGKKRKPACFLDEFKP